MATLRTVPPGRTGRIWLQRRLRLARHAASRLDQKLRILRIEQEHAALLLERTRPVWEERCREAETWLLRAALLGGQSAVRPPPVTRLADVSVAWTTSMGATYPTDSTCVIPEPDPDLAPPSSSAVIEATEAYRRALDAAVRHAVADGAARALEAEVAATRQRLRGVQDRWIPRLDEALTELVLTLDEAERAEGVRLRWAARQQARRPS
jgi:V/A-type H+-transporting ATPase subunit D